MNYPGMGGPIYGGIKSQLGTWGDVQEAQNTGYLGGLPATAIQYGQDPFAAAKKRAEQEKQGINPANAGSQSGSTSTGSSTSPGGSSVNMSEYEKAALDRLKKGVTEGPYSQQVQDQQLGQQQSMNAAAEAQQVASQRAHAAAGGGSLYDPSQGAAEQEFASNRQGANAAAAGNIATTATLANDAAQRQSANQLAQLGQSDRQTDAANRIRQQAIAAEQSRYTQQAGYSRTPSFNETYGGGTGYSRTPASGGFYDLSSRNLKPSGSKPSSGWFF